jgi:hypothetical protein
MTETAKMSSRLCDAQGVSLGCFLLTSGGFASLRAAQILGTCMCAHTRSHAHNREHLRRDTSERASEHLRRDTSERASERASERGGGR